ncbi:MAG: TonB-dependent receptor [Vicingaceae bacterium]
MKFKFQLTAIAVSLFYAGTTFAQEDSLAPKYKEVNLDAVLIQENRMTYKCDEVPKNMDVIDKKEMKSLSVQSVAELLSFQSGIDLRQRGPLGVQADIRINGGTFEQSLILLNGVKLTDPQSGHHLMNLPLDVENVERIDLIKGAATKRYGQNAFGGAINIITKVPDSNRLKLKLYGGDFNTQGGNVSVSFNRKRQHHYLSLGGDFSGGYRHNTDFEMMNAFYQGAFDFREKDQLNLILGRSDRKFGANGFYASRDATEQYEEIVTSMGILSYDWYKEGWKVMPRLSWRRNDDQYDYIREKPEIYRNFHSTQSLSAELHISNQNRLGETGLGFEHRSEFIQGDWLRSGVASPSNLDGFSRTNTSLYLEHKFRLFDELLMLSPGLYASWFSNFDGQLFPALDASFYLSEKMSVFGSVGKSYRVPTFYDQYYESPVESGSPNLKPEEAWSYEGGVRYNYNGFSAKTAYFQRDNTNLIDWVWNDSDEKWFAQNYSHMLSRGIDLSLEYGRKIDLIRDLVQIDGVRVSYFKMNQLDKTEGRQRSRYVMDYLNDQLIASISIGLFNRFDLHLAYRYLNRMEYDPYQVVDLKLAYRKPKYELFAEAANLTNTDYVEVMTPMPGRWFRAGLSLTIGY